MLSIFPDKIAKRAIYTYLGTLLVVSAFFISHVMPVSFIVIGIMWVVGFFLFTAHCSNKWQQIPENKLLGKLFVAALSLRVAWAIFSYFFYIWHTGMPFEFSAGDAFWYYEESVSNAHTNIGDIWRYLFVNADSISDSGYVFYLSLLAKITGESVLLPRLVNCLFSAATCIFVYKLARRNIGEYGGRLAAIMCCFMPNLIYYCGLHLKETFMLFILVAYLERVDSLLRSRKFSLWRILPPLLLAIALFSFRTVLGASALFAFVTALFFSSTKVMGRTKRIMLIVWTLVAVLTLAGGTIQNEIESTWEERTENQIRKRDHQVSKGVEWAKYATGTVMAPMMFVLPFPTMVNVDEQYNQQMISGGNYVRNFLGGFVLIALFTALFVRKNWRDLSLIGAFAIAYLGIVSMSGFANSERFLLPALPVLLIFAAYGVTELNAKTFWFMKIWYWIVPIMAFAWAFFKLGSRGLF